MTWLTLTSLLTYLYSGKGKTYLAERTIETELRKIETLLAANTTHTEQWLTLVDRLTDQLKELGDVSNWAQTLLNSAQEIRQLAKTVNETRTSRRR